MTNLKTLFRKSPISQIVNNAFLSKEPLTGVLPPETNIKSFHDIPSKKGFIPASLDLILAGGPGYLHEHCSKRHEELGPIFKEKLGAFELVFLADTKLIQSVIASEGQYPHHNVPKAWSYFNQVNKIERGIFFQIGEPWSRLRKVFNKILLADAKSITRFSQDILKINSDLLSNWKDTHSKCNADGSFVVKNVKMDLCKWSIESTGFMLFGNRMGCIPSSTLAASDARAEELVRNVSNMFHETSKFQLLPVELAHKLKLGTWKKFELASKRMIEIANEYAMENIGKVRAIQSESASLVGNLLKLDILTDEEVSRSLVDLIIAAADTTSNSLQWMLYLIAKHEDVQSKILEEISPLLEEELNVVDLRESAPYLRAFIREASRLYPTAPFLARTLDRDIILGGYSVPAGQPIVFSLFTTSRMDKYFDEPLKFKPERWLRSCPVGEKSCGRSKTHNHAYASLPFGIGARMCIGRRAAELEMVLFIASFVRIFKSDLPQDCNDMAIKLKMILCPEKPINLRLTPR